MTARNPTWREHARQARTQAARHGIPPEGLRAYRNQYQAARQRGIGWEFTLAEWWAWWQQDGRWERRGHGRDRLVMARHGDTGPYSASNVRAATMRENTIEAGTDRLHAASRAAWADYTTRAAKQARGAAHGHARAVVTPTGRYPTAAAAAAAHGLTRQGAADRARRGVQGWRYE